MARDRDSELSAQEVAGHTRLDRNSVLCHRNTLSIVSPEYPVVKNSALTKNTPDEPVIFPLGNAFSLKENSHEGDET